MAMTNSEPGSDAVAERRPWKEAVSAKTVDMTIPERMAWFRAQSSVDAIRCEAESARQQTFVSEEMPGFPAKSLADPHGDTLSLIGAPVRMRSLMHEQEMVHRTLTSGRDMSSQQRDYLEGAREEFAPRAKQDVTEFEMSDEMMPVEKAL